MDVDLENDIAVVGLACRLPGAAGPEEFWANLRDGVESVTRIHHPDTGELERAGGVVDDLEGFDATFFRLSRREAELWDPQQRMFAENCWRALESAGYAGRAGDLTVGVFGGMGISTYLLNNVWPTMTGRADRTMIDSPRDLQALIACDKDFITGRTAFLLDLRGPSVTVQAACATGLYAVHLACQALLDGDCDLALAGAANATVPQTSLPGLEEGMYLSRDGHTRSFDAAATGSVFGGGSAVVALRLLGDAIANGDPIRAVIKGSAVNNDGSAKSGLTAPSVRAQESVINQALRVAGVEPDEVGLIEAHGTATPIGDPIEVTALNRVFRGVPAESIALTTAKPNIGHLGHAAGIAGLAKAILCLENRQIPPAVNFSRPNPELDLAAGPLYVPRELRDWADDGRPRTAGVSAFGVGGYNAHVLLTEAPAPTRRPGRRDRQIIAVSGRSVGALDRTAEAWAQAVTAPGADLADLAHTSTRGREHMRFRRAVAGSDGAEIAEALRERAAGPVTEAVAEPRVGFLFTSYLPDLLGAAAPLLDVDAFRRTVERATATMREETGISALDVLGPDPVTLARENLVALQPTQFVLQAALYDLWTSWGLRPAAVLGHSLGEYAAAYAAGVIGLEDGIRLVAARSRLYTRLPEDLAMAVLHISHEEATAYCATAGGGVEVAAINGPASVVLAGPKTDLNRVTGLAEADGRKVVQLGYGRAGHVSQVDAVLDDFGQVLAGIGLRRPDCAFISNVTGAPVDTEVTGAEYWQRHMRQTVRFADGIRSSRDLGITAYLELGPAPVLSNLFMAAHEDFTGPVVGSLSTKRQPWEQLLDALAALHEHGSDVDWDRVAESGGGRLVPAPTYHFDRRRHWIDPPGGRQRDDATSDEDSALLYEPVWRPDGTRETAEETVLPGAHYLVVADDGDVAQRLVGALAGHGALCTVLDARADRDWPEAYRSRSGLDRATVEALIRESDLPFSGVLHLRGLDLAAGPAGAEDPQSAGAVGADGPEPAGSVRADDPEPAPPGGFDRVEAELSHVFDVLRVLTDDAGTPLRLWLVTRGAMPVGETDRTDPWQATFWGLAKCAAVEHPTLQACCVDLDPADGTEVDAIADALGQDELAELGYRGVTRFVRRLARQGDRPAPAAALDPEATYLVTGGLGTLGRLTAQALVGQGARHLMLLGRSQPDPAAREAVEALRRTARVTVRQLDVSDPDQVRDLVGELRDSAHPLRGVVHAAGVIDDATVGTMTAAKIRSVLAGKARGAWNLHRAIGDDPRLQFFTCYSSAASVIGNAGQANYGAANAFLDALVATRLAAGRPGRSLAWGAWADIGHLSADRATMAGLKRRGMLPLPEGPSRRLLRRLVTTSGPLFGVLANDWPVWATGVGAAQTDYYAEVLEGAEEPEDPAEQQRRSAPLDLTGLDRETKAATVTAEVLRAIREVVGGADDGSGAFGPDTFLADLGLDSFSAIQVRNRLQSRFGVGLPVSALLTLNAPQDIAKVVLERVGQPG